MHIVIMRKKRTALLTITWLLGLTLGLVQAQELNARVSINHAQVSNTKGDVFDALQKALDKSYAAVDKISFENAHYRKDIGARALAAIN